MKTINNILIYGAVAVMSLLGSCTKGIEEQGGGELAPGTVQVQLVVPTGEQNKSNSRAAIDGTTAENFIGNVQMLFWHDRSNNRYRYLSIDPKKPVVDVGTVWNPATGTLTIRNSGFYDCVVYVMVNGKGDELSKEFKDRAEILNVIAEHSGAIIDPATDPLPMSGISPMVHFNDENTAQVTVELHRMVAKVNVTVNLDADFLKAYPDCVFGTAAGQEAALKLVNIPSKSYVFQKTPIVIPPTAVDANNISDMPVKENGTGKDMTWTTTAYVFENPTVDPATSMKIGLYLPYKDGTNPAATSNYYQLLAVNNTATADRVKRNWIYNMTVTVNGFGKENVTVNTIVEPWNVENIDIPVDGSYVRFNTEKVILKHKGIYTVKILSSLAMDKFTVSVSNATNTLLTQTGSDLELKAFFTDFNAQTEYKKLGTLTVTSKEDPKLTHTIDVFYEPIVFAGFDIVLGADSTYKIGSEATHKDVLLFNAASNIGTKAADFPPGTGDMQLGWTTAHTYYTPNANPQIAVTPASGKDYFGMMVTVT